MNEKCAICGEPISGVFVTTGHNSVAHRHCYEREHPPRVAHTLYEVARGCGDPVLAAEVINEMTPADIGSRIVDEFNKRNMQLWRCRCEA